MVSDREREVCKLSRRVLGNYGAVYVTPWKTEGRRTLYEARALLGGSEWLSAYAPPTQKDAWDNLERLLKALEGLRADGANAAVEYNSLRENQRKAAMERIEELEREVAVLRKLAGPS